MYYSTSRDYGVFDTDANDVAAVGPVFNADYAKTSITPSDGDDLVWSPTDSQTHLLALINGAQHSLDIEQEEFGDTALVNAIVAAENRGVTVRVVVESPSSYTTELNEVTAAGGQWTGYSSSTGFYVHAKAIVADYGTPTAKVFLGSENFSVQLAQQQPRAGPDHHRFRRHERRRVDLHRRLQPGRQRRRHRKHSRQPDQHRRHRGQPADIGDRHRGRHAVLPRRPGCPPACRSAPRPA